MLFLLKKNINNKNTIFLKSDLGIIDIFIIDKLINTSKKIQIFILKKKKK